MEGSGLPLKAPGASGLKLVPTRKTVPKWFGHPIGLAPNQKKEKQQHEAPQMAAMP